MLQRFLLGPAVVVLLHSVGAVSAVAQVRLPTVEDVRREVKAGDVISVVRNTGQPVMGELIRFGDTELDIQPRGKGTVTLPLSDLRSLERPRDSSRNGALIGAGIGGGISLGMFVWAVSVDRNEIDEWGAAYAVGGAVYTGLGALIGWAIDRAHSKPHVRYDAASATSTTIRVAPSFERGAGMRVTVSF